MGHYYTDYDHFWNEQREERFQFYIYREGEEDWIDVYSADDLDDGYKWAIETIQKFLTEERHEIRKA